MSNQAICNGNHDNDIERIEGKIKWYSPEKGYGFLIPDDGSEDVFMHFSVLDASGCPHVEEGDHIVCEVGPGVRGQQAYRILEVKSALGERHFSPSKLDSRSPAFDLESLEEVEGEVKWFNPLKGFGFIYPDDRGKDIFLHESVLRAAGYELIAPGVQVKIKVSASERGRKARALTIITNYARKEANISEGRL